jgi:hypothetical protein
VEPPLQVDLLLSAVDGAGFPRLRGVRRTPTLRLDAPGYDAASGLFLWFEPGEYPAAPADPTREQARGALDRLARPLRGFPFANPASRSVALSALLSAVVRGELRTCPLHGISAPVPGTGKTKLSALPGLLATGVPPTVAAYARDTEEMEKRLVAFLRYGDPVVLLDNVTAPLEGDFLCMALTSDVVQARILGLSERAKLDTRTLLLATGNNLGLRGDMVRRAIVCTLDAGMERPDEREFDFDPEDEVRQGRPQLVVDALTVLRAYDGAGRPRADGWRPLGSFEDWELVRGALLWLGEADPLDTQERARDEARDEREDLLVALWRRFRNEWFHAREIEAYEETRTDIAAMLNRGEWDRRAAGRLLARHRNFPLGDMVLRSSLDRKGTAMWRVEGKPPGGDAYRTEDDIPF